MSFSVDFEELDTYPRTRWQNGIFLGTRQLKCAWSDRITLLREIDTYPNNVWPYGDGPSDAIVIKVQDDPLGKQTGAAAKTASYDWAILTVWYANEGPRLYGNQDLITEWIEGYGGGQILPWGNLRWTSSAGAGLLAEEAPRLSTYGFVLAQTWHRQYGVPLWVRARTRRVNPAAYSTFLVGFVFPPETMLYQPPHIISTAKLWGLNTYDITVRYLIHSSWADNQAIVGWNTFWRLGTANYEPAYLSSGDRYIQYPGWTI